MLTAQQLLQGTHIICKKASGELVEVAMQNMLQVKVIQKWDNQPVILIECGSDRDIHAGYHGRVGERLIVSGEWF